MHSEETTKNSASQMFKLNEKHEKIEIFQNVIFYVIHCLKKVQ